jgi:deazaflavin-dependent oxidoreductase (nitroreductase family)
VSDWNTNIISEFRNNDGKVGGMFEGAPLAILTTTGAKTGATREAPLMYRQEGQRRFVFASKAGADTHPDWFHNIKANSTVKVEVPGDTYSATAVILDDPERAAVYERHAAEWPQFAEYQQKTDRAIPVVELIPI